MKGHVSVATALVLSAGVVLSLVVVLFTFKGTSDALLSVLSLIVGVCVGVVWDDAWDFYRASRRDKPTVDRHPDETQQQTTNRRRFNSTTTLGWTLIVTTVCAAVTGILLITTKAATEAYSQCTAQWQQQFGEAYTARVEAAREVSDAMDAIVLSVSADDRSAFHKAVEDYLNVRESQKRDQAANPLPPLPEVLCGER